MLSLKLLRSLSKANYHSCLKRNSSSEPVLFDLERIQKEFVVRRRGDDGYGSREYLLVPPDASKESFESDPSIAVATLLAHRNIIFGARTSSSDAFKLQDVCLPLVEQAVRDAGENGEQPQAIASLVGLSDWVKESLKKPGSSDILDNLQASDPASYEAVQALATGIPRPGHSVVGVGTYRDAEEGWKKVATEFIEKGLSEESQLYQARSARLVTIEHLADRNPDYLAAAGGAMARFFFL